ncbi:EamA family transporter [Marivirga sp.]|uniref:EamA family transporter n=1 Tax=Marivirga sp. TaxID=2018662 RepID=UPI0025CCA895|nr:EamA family transporter [Marivirga sp.]
MNYIYIYGTIFFTIYGQIILKWRLNKLGSLPNSFTGKMYFLLDALMDLYIFSGFLSAFIASLFWMAAMTKFEITVAYPFMSLSPALVFFIGIFLLGETFTWGKLIGLLLIILGTLVTVKF